ncbi:MAG: WD40 repeat domain-containing protein, partial [Anaerolineae bacterium]
MEIYLMRARYLCFVSILMVSLFSPNENLRAQNQPPIMAFALSPDGRYLAVSYYDQPRTVEIIETQTKKIVWSYSLQNAINPKPVWSPNSQYIALFDFNSIEVVETTTGEEIKGFQNERDNYVFAVSWNPDSKFIAIATSSGIGLAEETYIKIWDVKKVELVKSILEGLVEPSGMTWSPDGAYLAISGFERPTFVLTVETGNNDLHLENGYASSTDWHPDNKRIATGELEGQACIWDAQSGELLNAFETGYDIYAHAKWSPDGTKLLVALEENWPAWVWYVAENRALLLEGFTSNGVLQVWSADSTQLVYE